MDDTAHKELRRGKTSKVVPNWVKVDPIAYGFPATVPYAGRKIQKSSENHAKSVRIEARGTSWGRCGAILGFPLAQRAKNIQNVSSWTALGGPPRPQI